MNHGRILGCISPQCREKIRISPLVLSLRRLFFYIMFKARLSALLVDIYIVHSSLALSLNKTVVYVALIATYFILSAIIKETILYTARCEPKCEMLLLTRSGFWIYSQCYCANYTKYQEHRSFMVFCYVLPHLSRIIGRQFTRSRKWHEHQGRRMRHRCYHGRPNKQSCV